MGKWKGPPHEDIARCGAKTRQGHPCGHYSMPNGRCRYHGGRSLKGRTGKSNPNYKHGWYSQKMNELRQQLAQLGRMQKKIDDLVG